MLSSLQLLESISALTKAIIDFNLSEKRHHESFLSSFQSLKTQIRHQSEPPTNLVPPSQLQLLPRQPVICSTIETNLAVTTNSAVPKTHEKSKMLVAKEENVEDEYLAMGYDAHQKSEVVVIMGNVGAGLKKMSTCLPWFVDEPVLGSSFLYKSTERHISTATLVVTSPVPLICLPGICLFCFDPGGAISEFSISVVRLRSDRRFSVRHAYIFVKPLPSPSYSPPSAASPSWSVQTNSSLVWISFQTMSPPLGPAYCWPWVPWSIRTHNNFRVSSGLCESLKCHPSLMGFTTCLGHIANVGFKRQQEYIWSQNNLIWEIDNSGPGSDWRVPCRSIPHYHLVDKVSLKGRQLYIYK